MKLRIEDPKSLESIAVEPAIAGEQRISLEESMRADEQIGDDPDTRCAWLPSEIAPKAARPCGCVLGNRLESDAEQVERFGERGIGREMSANLGPDDLASNESTRVVSNSQGLTRLLSVDWIGSQNIQKDGGVDSHLHRRRAVAFFFRRAGRGPRIWSMISSTGLPSFRRPNSWSTG